MSNFSIKEEVRNLLRLRKWKWTVTFGTIFEGKRMEDDQEPVKDSVKPFQNQSCVDTLRMDLEPILHYRLSGFPCLSALIFKHSLLIPSLLIPITGPYPLFGTLLYSVGPPPCLLNNLLLLILLPIVIFPRYFVPPAKLDFSLHSAHRFTPPSAQQSVVKFLVIVSPGLLQPNPSQQISSTEEKKI